MALKMMARDQDDDHGQIGCPWVDRSRVLFPHSQYCSWETPQ